jgi:hypothetical protein
MAKATVLPRTVDHWNYQGIPSNKPSMRVKLGADDGIGIIRALSWRALPPAGCIS